jgi:predicted transcriptional regulator
MAALDEIPGLRSESEQVLAKMIEDDRLYVESLAAIRKAASLTQIQMGEHMGVSQSVISRLEKQDDMLLSTLASYLAAAGDHPRVVVTVNGQDVEYDLTVLKH